MRATTMSRLEGILRPVLALLPPKFVVKQYSRGRLAFLAKLKDDLPVEAYEPPKTLSRVLWGITFRSPIMNAAGMFKNAECYDVASRQGAGAYLGGTGTWNSRGGNEKHGVRLPFAPYPRSHAASNWLGLPNDGDAENSARASKISRVAGCPLGWSVMGSPDLNGDEKLSRLTDAMHLYARAGVDFLEMNESCPNTSHGKPQDDDLARRLRYIKEHFLDRRQSRLPVIVKFSNDTAVEQVPALLDLLFSLGYDGVNFGNTSTQYAVRRENINALERGLFDYFTSTFGGGVSGRPLKEASLALTSRAVEYVRAGPPSQEFHVIRTGGIETIDDITDSEQAGIPLNQWFTGYFERFALHGHDVYRNVFE